jgi:hypothetical protein
MKRRPLDRNARSLEPHTQFGENIVDEALIARVVYQPVHDVAVGNRIDFWRRVHILLPNSDLDRRYRICRVSVRRRQWSPPQSACAHRVVGGLPRVRAGGRSSSAALSLSTHNSQPITLPWQFEGLSVEHGLSDDFAPAAGVRRVGIAPTASPVRARREGAAPLTGTVANRQEMHRLPV